MYKRLMNKLLYIYGCKFNYQDIKMKDYAPVAKRHFENYY